MAQLTAPYFEDEVTKEMKKNNPRYTGYCRTECKHRDCEEVRKGRATPCTICGKPIEAGESIYLNDDGSYKHAVCVWEKEASV
jgi:hypothetical protein